MTGIFYSVQTKKNDKQLLLLFMAAWFIINCLQGYFLNLEGDESYYWALSQNLDWGYFDHPPFAPLLINLGESLSHGPLFTRLGTIITSTITIPLIYFSLPDKARQIRLYILLYCSILLFNVYGFITTPDAPLLMFTAFFFYCYKKFLKKETIATVLLMALAITGMFYSKYHGILAVGFVVLSNPKLLISKYFWIVILMVSLLFLPHLLWQYQHDWPTFRFHLIERLAKKYNVSFTTDYLSGQLLVWGPIISLFFFYHIFKIKIKDKLLRAHFFTFVGVLLFFLFSSFKNNVEPHWTLIAGISFVTLFMQLLADGSEKLRRNFRRFCYVNIALIILARILFLIPGSPFQKIGNYAPMFYGKEWADSVYSKAANQPVLFTNSYVLPSLYRFYHPDAKAIGYNTKGYRKTNYSLTTEDCKYDGEDILLFTANDSSADSGIAVNTNFAKGWLIPLEKYTCINGLKIRVENMPEHVKANQKSIIRIEIENKSKNSIDSRGKLEIDYAFFVAKYDFINSNEKFFLPDSIMAPGYKKKLNIPVQTPATPGKYKLLFSITNGKLEGNFASPFYNVVID